MTQDVWLWVVSCALFGVSIWLSRQSTRRCKVSANLRAGAYTALVNIDAPNHRVATETLTTCLKIISTLPEGQTP